MNRRPALGLALILGFFLVGIFLVTRYVAIPWTVAGDSMAPTLNHGDRVLVEFRTYRERPPATGELVLLERPGSLRIVKRVSAGSPPPGHLFVAGDNPGASVDSRQFGPVPVQAVLGRVFFRYWPPSEAGPIR